MVLIATNTIIIEYQRQEIGLKISVEHLVSVMIKSNDIKQVKLVLRLLSQSKIIFRFQTHLIFKEEH